MYYCPDGSVYPGSSSSRSAANTAAVTGTDDGATRDDPGLTRGAPGSHSNVQCNHAQNYCCNPSTGYCYCEDDWWNKVPGTDQFGTPAPGQCTSAAPGSTVQCDSNGECCNPSTNYCWCVYSNGQKVPGTDIFGHHSARYCSQHNPSPNPPGSNENVVCDGNSCCNLSTNYCWCIYSNGQKVPGTTQFGKPSSRWCSHYNPSPSPNPSNPPGSDDNIKCYAMQRYCCNPSTNYCWCWDFSGNKVPGTEQQGTPDCSWLYNHGRSLPGTDGSDGSDSSDPSTGSTSPLSSQCLVQVMHQTKPAA